MKFQSLSFGIHQVSKSINHIVLLCIFKKRDLDQFPVYCKNGKQISHIYVYVYIYISDR